MSGMNLRPIDVVIIRLLAVLHLVNGLYLMGPWYIAKTNGMNSPLLNLFSNRGGVVIYGLFLTVNALLLWYSTGRNKRIRLLSANLLAGFLLRLYSLIGVILVLPGWLPPSYASHLSTVLIIGAYWIYVKIEVRRNEFATK